MVHRLGGPPKMVEAYRNGGSLFVYWPLNGLIRIVNSSGALWDNRKGPWRVSSRDLHFMLTGEEPLIIPKG